jgi:LPXTG-motif cell wall-anchored protein
MGTAMTGLARRVLLGLAVAVLASLVLPATVAVAQEGSQYPPTSSSSPVEVKAASVEDPGDPGDPAVAGLAVTGSSDSISMVWVAVGLVVFGGALVFVARQRRSAANRT